MCPGTATNGTSRLRMVRPIDCSASDTPTSGSSKGLWIESVYIELHAASAFSFLQGASLPETLVERAASLGYPALALLDADGVYGAPRFHKAAQRAGLKAIIGAELTIGRQTAVGGRQNEAAHTLPTADRLPPTTWSLPVLAETQEGYRNLCRLITLMTMRADPPGPLSTRQSNTV